MTPFFFFSLSLLVSLSLWRTPAALCLQLPCTEDVTADKVTVAYQDGFSHLFGDHNIQLSEDGKAIQLHLDRNTGSGFVSKGEFLYGLVSANIKLPKGYTAGVVTAFYTSNANRFPKNHDEIDFEFLGNVRRRQWRVQTNIYGNGSIHSGREERYTLWFDPTESFHKYSILWTQSHIVFFVDNIPIRQVVRTEAMGGDYPSKPMSVYATVWDGSDWATSGGRYKANYKYAPFTTTFTDLVVQRSCDTESCLDNMRSLPSDSTFLHSGNHKAALRWFRRRHVTYSYCEDEARYPNPLPECPSRQRRTGRQ